jgi:hypothetical protein
MSVKTLLPLLDTVDWVKVRADNPKLTLLSLHILTILAWRENEDYKRTHLSESQWLTRLGCGRSAYFEGMKTLVDAKFVERVTRGSNTNFTRANFRVRADVVNTLPKIVRHSGLDDVILSDVADSVVRDIGLDTPLERTQLSVISDAKLNKLNKLKETISTSLRFDSIIRDSLPENLRFQINSGDNFEKLLDECDELGITNDVSRLLATNKWNNVCDNPGGIVHKIIKSAIERKRNGQLVIAPIQVTHQPPPFVREERVIEPISDATRAEIDALRVKFGSLRK